MTELELARIAERIGADRLEAFCACAPAESVAAYGLRWRRADDAVQMACDRVPNLNRNRTQGLGLDEPLTPERLADLAAFHRERGIEEFMLQVAPGARPAGHEALLRDAGFTWWRRRVAHLRDASTMEPVRCAFDVREVDVRDARAFAELTVAQHDSPRAFVPWAETLVRERIYRAFIAWRGEHAVASATISLGPHGAWLGGAFTSPEARGQGAQAALLAARITAAREANCAWLMVETLEPFAGEDATSERNVARAGFRAVAARPSWVPQRS